MTTEIAAPPDKVWSMLADLTRMHEWSPENEEATWSKGASAAAPGAEFKGINRAGKHKWATRGTVVEAVPGRVLSFRVTGMRARVALWTYRIEPTADGCSVTETWVDERNPLTRLVGRPVSGVVDRATHNREGMEVTLRNLKAAAEASPAGEA